MEQSIYEQLKEHISNGILDNSFSLPEEESDWSSLRFAPGALDGMYIYHMGGSEMSKDAAEQMAKAINQSMQQDWDGVDALFCAWAKHNRTVNHIDDLQHYVIDHREVLDPSHLFQAALYMVLNSNCTECVKAGLALLELFGEPNDPVKEIIRNLGLYDEFTLFAVWNMRHWQHGNADIFVLAQKTHSWGRIHAVEHLEPETEEIRHWLLTEGTVNQVINAYSALPCWQKSGAEGILFGQPTPEEFTGIATIIDGLLDEDPAPGISQLDNPEGVLRRFLQLVADHSPDLSVYETVLSIQDWAEGEGQLPSIAEASSHVLHSPACTAAIEKAVQEGKGLRLAEKMHIPFRPQLLACLQRDLNSHYYNVRYLLQDPAFVEPVLKLYRRQLPLEAMRGDPVDGPCLGKEYEHYDQLQLLIQELDSMPLTGVDFIQAALSSPAARNRFRALAVLQAWVEKKKTPLSALLPDVYAQLLQLRQKENEEKHIQMIDRLTEGHTTFSGHQEREVSL